MKEKGSEVGSGEMVVGTDLVETDLVETVVNTVRLVGLVIFCAS